MAAKFSAITKDNIRSIGTILVSSQTSDPYDILDSYDKSDAYDANSVEHMQHGRHQRKIISLTAPTFNHVTGRSDCDLLRKVLQIGKKEWQGIVKFQLIMDQETEELIPIDEVDTFGAYLYGAQIAEHYINKFDIEKALMNSLYKACSSIVSSSTAVRSVIRIDNNQSDGLLIAANFYMHYDPEVLAKKLKRGVPLDNNIMVEIIRNALMPNEDSVFTYLLNMKRDKSGLYGMLNYYLVVVPCEMRPKIDNREHPLTKLYAKVINANNELKLNLNGSQPKTVMSSYASLERWVRRCQYKRQDDKNARKDDLALMERIKSKRGQIRMYNLGKRQDYSGRAVVCINPYLPLDVIRVPKSMLAKLLEFHILPYMAKSIRAVNYHAKMGGNPTSIYTQLSLGNLDNAESRTEMLRIINDEHLLDKCTIVMGRQPTLHKQSLQGFRIEISEYQAIEVNPLVCPAFNMDFDGDQAHIEVQLSDKAIEEARYLVTTTQNLFLPKSGECTAEPRQDMLYGLWMCTKNEYSLGKSVASFENLEAVRQAVMNHKVRCSDTVSVVGYGSLIAGDAAFMGCFDPQDIVPRGKVAGVGQLAVQQIDKHSITPYINNLLRTDYNGRLVHRLGTGYAGTDTVVGVINRLVELGFKVARLYPPNISTINLYESARDECKSVIDNFCSGISVSNINNYETLSDNLDKALPTGTSPSDRKSIIDTIRSIGSGDGTAQQKVSKLNSSLKSLGVYGSTKSKYEDSLNKFYSSLDEIEFYYSIGMETIENYKNEFAKSLDTLNKSRKDHIIDSLGKDNGYVKMSESGARGSKDNLLQTFSIKGQVKKNNVEAFDALIENSYQSQLTPMEHGLAAFGGRQGQIDKSLKTGDTGYAMRQMWHATQGMSIVTDDCGTKDGITISKKDLRIFVSDSSTKEIEELFEHAITGRYDAKTGTIIGVVKAAKLAKDPSVDSVVIRSPITCKNPCCVKCYGLEWSTHRDAIVGTPVGIIAAQAIGEPGTQLTMQTFHKGGLAGNSDVTSAFDKVNEYISVSNIAKKSSNGTYSGYDPLAWATGKVIEEPSTIIGKKKITIEGFKGKSILVPSHFTIKTDVIRGEGISYAHGDYDINEVRKYGDLYDHNGNLIRSGIRAAQMYLTFKLHALYKSEINIKMIHFEVLVASMTRYMVVSTDRKDLIVGQYATAQELYRGSMAHTIVIPRLLGVRSLTTASHDALDSIIMESQVRGLSRACLLGMTDTLTKPINRIVMGKTILNGSRTPGFIESRRELI